MDAAKTFPPHLLFATGEPRQDAKVLLSTVYSNINPTLHPRTYTHATTPGIFVFRS